MASASPSAGAASAHLAALSELSLDTHRFVALLQKLVAETPRLMNKPPEFVPQESLAARHVLEVLKPYTTENGGPLEVKEVAYVKDRSNVVIRYRGTGPRTVSFVGCHMDVVYADPKVWQKDPFKLDVTGDILYGRGTTDCLGHVALVTDIFIQLAKLKPKLNLTVVGVLIADEEVGSNKDVGVEALMHRGELDDIKNGPVYWVDCSDKQPNIGSGGTVQWKLIAHGRTFHSGFPHKAVNAIELGMAAMIELQQRFYKEFPTHPKEKEYGFPCSSSLKPTLLWCPDGSLNQIRGECVISGDVRLVPFYRVEQFKKKFEEWVEELNKTKFKSLVSHGPSKFDVAEVHSRLELEWLGSGMNGLACDLNSDGFRCLAEATKRFVGEVKPLADTGSLPLVAELKDFGYDVQTIGYGIEDAYHADDEYAKLSDFEIGFKVLMEVIRSLDEKSR